MNMRCAHHRAWPDGRRSNANRSNVSIDSVDGSAGAILGFASRFAQPSGSFISEDMALPRLIITYSSWRMIVR